MYVIIFISDVLNLKVLFDIKKEKDWIVGSNLNSKILVGSLKEIKDELIKL